MIIDMHTHVFPPEQIAARQALQGRDRWFGLLYENPKSVMVDADQLVRAMDCAGVDRAVIFGFAYADPGLCAECNRYVLDAARGYSERLIPFALVNPCRGEPAWREARRCLEGGARGFGELMPDGQGFALTDDATLDPLMHLARQANVPVMTHVNELVGHTYCGKGSQGLEAAYQLAMRHPENRIVLAHWGGGLPFFELMPEVRRALRNVYYDTAASLFLYDDAVVKHVMAWAPTKVLYGSDYPLIGFRRFLRRMERAGLTPENKARFLGENARLVLGEVAPISDQIGEA